VKVRQRKETDEYQTGKFLILLLFLQVSMFMVSYLTLPFLMLNMKKHTPLVAEGLPLRYEASELQPPF
jgi:hypothetical protein